MNKMRCEFQSFVYMAGNRRDAYILVIRELQNPVPELTEMRVIESVLYACVTAASCVPRKRLRYGFCLRKSGANFSCVTAALVEAEL